MSELKWKEYFMSIRTCMLADSAIAVAAPGAMAQTNDIQDDEITVTGSRIERDPNAVAPVPVQSINREDIVASGEFNLVDIVNDIPALTNSTSVE